MSEIKDYYEGLRKAAEISPEYEQEIENYTITKDEGYSDDEVAFSETFQQMLNFQYLALQPLSNVYNYLTHSVLATPEYYENCIESDKTCDRGIKYRPKEIFTILSSLNPRVAYYVIGKITDEAGSYEDLTYAIDDQDEKLFLDTMRNGHCHISDAVNRLCYYFTNFDIQQTIDDIIDAGKDGCDEDVNEAIGGVLGKLQRMTNEEWMAEANDRIMSLFQEMSELPEDADIKERSRILTSLIQELSKYCKYLYRFFFEIEPDYTPREQAVLDSITKRPEVAQYFEQWRQEFEEEDNSEAQIDNADNYSEKSDAIKASKSRGCWIINGTQADTIVWRSNIEKLWDGTLKRVGGFKLPEDSNLTARQARQLVSRISVALIYKAAEEVELAKPYLKTDGIGVSFEETIKPIVPDYRRQAMPRYMKMLTVFEEMGECVKRNNFHNRMSSLTGYNFSKEFGTPETAIRYNEDDLDSENPTELASDYKEEDESLSYVLIHNYDNINDSLIWLRQRIKAKMAK